MLQILTGSNSTNRRFFVFGESAGASLELSLSSSSLSSDSKERLGIVNVVRVVSFWYFSYESNTNEHKHMVRGPPKMESLDRWIEFGWGMGGGRVSVFCFFFLYDFRQVT